LANNVVKYDEGNIENSTADQVTPAGAFTPDCPKNASQRCANSSANKQQTDRPPWTVVGRAFDAIDVIEAQNLDTRIDRPDPIDSNFEIALKEFIVNRPRLSHLTNSPIQKSVRFFRETEVSS